MLYFRIALLCIFTVTQTPQAFANPNLVGDFVSSHDIFSNSVNRNTLYFDANKTAVNEFRLLGLNYEPNSMSEGLKNALNAKESLVLKSPETLTTNARYNSLLETFKGRAELFRIYDEALRNWSVTSGRNISVETRDMRRNINAQVVEEFSRNSRLNSLPKEVFAERVTLETNRRILMQAPLEERLAADERRILAQSRTNTAAKRVAIAYQNGLAPGRVPGRMSIFNPRTKMAAARGYYTLYVKDAKGREVPTFHPVDPSAMKNENAPRLMRQLAQGSMELTLFGAIFMGFMVLSTGYNMVADFESNPNAFADSYDMVPIMGAAGMGFVLGGAATHSTVHGLGKLTGISANPRDVALTNIAHAIENKEAYSSRGLRMKVLKANVAAYKSILIGKATSYWGISGGMIASQVAAKYAHSLRSCSRMLKLDYGQYPKHERDQIEASCQKTFLSITGEVISDPVVWKDVLAILSTKALFSFGISPAMAALYSMSKDVRAPEVVRKLRDMASNVPHGLKVLVKFPARAGALLLHPNVIGFVAFFAVFEFVSHKFDLVLDKLTFNVPANRAAENIRVLMQEYEQSGWDMDELCKNRNFIEGSFWGTLKSLWYMDKGEKCSQDLLTSFLNFHANSNKAWREKIKKPVNDSIMAWSYYTFQAINMYKATKMFYKDIVDQVRIKRASGDKMIFPRSRDGQRVKAHFEANHYNETLPLFRSDIFFGWRYRINEEDGDALGYPISNGKTVSWDERVQSNESKEMLDKQLERFKAQVLPKAIEELSKAPGGVRAEAERIKNILESANDNINLAYGLKILAEATEEENRNALSKCTYKLSLHDNWELFNDECFFTILNTKFLDKEFWIRTEEGEFIFNKSIQNPYRAGYKTIVADPFGVKPLHLGQRFLIDYNRRFENNGIDHLYFEEGYEGLTDSLLKGMICGIDVANGERMYEEPGFFGRHVQPVFSPPKLVLKGGVNPCGRTELANGKVWDNGWNYYHGGFYSYIRDTQDESKSYNGIVEFLYNEIDDSMLNDFDSWWASHVQPQFEEVIDKVYKEYYLEEVIDQQFAEALNKDNNDTNCYETCRDFEFEHKESIAATIKQEIDTYLTYFLEPILNDLPLDTKKSEIKDEEGARAKILSDYQLIKTEIYAIFDFMTGRIESLVGFENLNEDFQLMMEEAAAQMDLQQSGGSQNYDLVKLRALKTIMYDRFYDFKVLFKSDDGAMLQDIFEVTMEHINGVDFSSAEEKEEAIEGAKQEFITLSKRYDSLAEREGKVLLSYPDWPDGVTEGPTMQVVRTTHNIAMRLFSELISLEELKQTIKPINQY